MTFTIWNSLVGAGAAAILWPAAAASAPPPNPYMGDPVETVVAPNGAIINAQLAAARADVGKARVVKVRERVWTIRDFSIVNCIVVETRDGLVVLDTGVNIGEGETFLAEIRKLSNKPILAIVYSHSHYTRGASAIVKGAGRADVMIVGHPRVEKNQGAASLDLAPSRQRRVNMQFGNLLPAQGPDARLGVPSPPVSDPAKLASGHLAVTRPVADGERLAIGGTEFVFIHAQGDTDDSLSVWIPELSTVVTNVTAKQFFAMYTLRGEPYRDPRGIIEGYDDIRALQPEHYVPMHGDAVSGAAEINRILTAHRDAYAFTFNQAIRGINKGWGPDELVANTHLPEHLRSEPTLYQGYSEFDFALRGIYRGLIGWYGEDAAEMHPPSPAVLGATIVEGFGGRDRLLARVGRAMEQRQYALAAKLAGYAVAAAPEDAAARTAKAAALRKLAQVSWGTQGYNFYLTEALHLEGKIDMHKSPAAAATRSYSGVAAAPTAALVSVLESRIDPERSRHVEKALAIRFRDTGEAFTIAVRRGVAETRPGAAADALHLETDRRSWFELTKRIVLAEELVREGRISAPQGQVASLAAFLELFDAD